MTNKYYSPTPVFDTLSDTISLYKSIYDADNPRQQIKKWLEHCFSQNLYSATVHWLRHTGISDDVKNRPREHVRDDAGHSSGAITDRYIDVELAARAKSAKNKSLVS